MVFVCMQPELLREAPVNTQSNLNVERIGAMGMPCPPLGEQENIAKHAEQETATFDIAITRLVADVVTGKVDVREAVAGLPEEGLSDLSDESDPSDEPPTTEEAP